MQTQTKEVESKFSKHSLPELSSAAYHGHLYEVQRLLIAHSDNYQIVVQDALKQGIEPKPWDEYFKDYVNKQDNFGRTALMYACMRGRAGIASNLLKAGADVHPKDMHGRTPLAHCISVECVKLLVEAGANINAEDGQGRTILDQYAFLDEIDEPVEPKKSLAEIKKEFQRYMCTLIEKIDFLISKGALSKKSKDLTGFSEKVRSQHETSFETYLSVYHKAPSTMEEQDQTIRSDVYESSATEGLTVFSSPQTSSSSSSSSSASPLIEEEEPAQGTSAARSGW